MKGSFNRSLLVACLLAGACSKSADGPKPKAKPLPSIAAEADGATSTGSGETDAMPEDWEPTAVIEIDADGSAPQGNVLRATPIEPEPAKVEWSEVATAGADVQLVYFATGVLARVGKQLLEPDRAGKLVARAGLQLPPGETVGDWPDDAWVHEAKVLEKLTATGSLRVEHRLWHFERDSFVPQEYERERSWVATGLELRKSWQSGYLIRADSSRAVRLGSSSRDNPKVGPRMGKAVVAIAETRSGKLYNVSERHNGLYAQRNCINFQCVEDNAVKLPYSKHWSFTIQVPRQRHSISMAAVAQTDDGAKGNLLLHYEIGGWKLESMVHPPSGMWPGPEGGLWVIVQGALWFRDADERWYVVALPKGAGPITAAMAEDDGQLWLATTIAGQGKLFTTAAEPDLGD